MSWHMVADLAMAACGVYHLVNGCRKGRGVDIALGIGLVVVAMLPWGSP